MAELEEAGGSGNTGQTTIGPDSRKLTKSEAGFREDEGIAGLRCGDCRFYEKGKCQIVEGDIQPEDVCDQFEPALQDGNISMPEATELRTLPVNQTFDLFISRVSVDEQSGKRRWYATSSGVKKDLYGERMSVQLFDDFIERIKNKEKPPEPFTSRAWNGGLPYLGIAHYLDLEGFAIVGNTDQIWRDGTVLKAKGTFRDTKLADAVFKAIQEDMENNIPDDQRVRVSIAFIDYGHNHGARRQFVRKSLRDMCMYCQAGVDEKEYVAGHLIHLATTRRPAYLETEIVALEEKSMSQKRDDAASIVGDEFADELERKSKEGLLERSIGAGDVAPGVVVIKSEDSEAPLGGAKTLDEAEQFIEKASEEAELLDSWAVLRGVLTNIVGDGDMESSEKAEAIREALGGFRQTLDVQTAETLMEIQRTIMKGKEMSKKEVLKKRRDKMEDEEEEELELADEEAQSVEVELEEEEEEDEYMGKGKKPVVKSHPLDDAYTSLKALFDQALETPANSATRLQMVQEAFNDFGAEIQAQINAASLYQPQNSLDPEAIQRAVESAMAPLQAEITALKSQLSEGAGSGGGVPSRRAIRMPIMTPGNPVQRSADQSAENPTPKLRSIIRRTSVDYEQSRGVYR